MLTKEQFEERKTYLGASDAAIMFTPGGLYDKTRMDIYLRLTRGEEMSEDTPYDRTYWGSANQDAIIDAFRQTRDLTVYAPENVVRMRDDFRFGALADGYVLCEQAPVEVKNRGIEFTNVYDPCGGTKVYEPDRIQLNWQMMVYGDSCPHGYLAVLIGGNDFRWLKVERDPALISSMYTEAKKFMENNVEKKIPPEPEREKDCNRLYNEDRGEKSACIATDEVLLSARSCVSDMKEKRRIEEDIDLWKTDIKQHMGTNRVLIDEDGNTVARWTRNDKGSRFTFDKRFMDLIKKNDGPIKTYNEQIARADDMISPKIGLRRFEESTMGSDSNQNEHILAKWRSAGK